MKNSKNKVIDIKYITFTKYLKKKTGEKYSKFLNEVLF